MTGGDKAQPLLPAAKERRLELGQWEKSQKEKGPPDDRFCDNVVITSKYNVIPLLPSFIVWRNLWEQFHRYANIYFLVVSALQLIPGLSPTGRFTTVIPLSMVLGVTMVKDGYEDYKRHVRDREVNNQKVKVFRSGQWIDIFWKDVVVGDYCMVERDVCAEFPADLLLLWSNEPQLLCQIETSNLDGETNLKLRKAHTEPAGSPGPPFDPQNPAAFQGTVICQQPNKDLYKFEGTLVRECGGQRTTSAIDLVSILLRGAKLGGSTKVVIGCVVYTGRQSKLMMNQQRARHKSSQLELATNRQIKFIFAMLLSLCALCAIGLGATVESLRDHWYVGEGVKEAWLEAIMGLGTFLILFNNLIPISLYVSMEMVKIIQARLIDSDLDMYFPDSDMPSEAKTSSLNEELGQVQYVFSDKTGTLTCNIMDFLKFSVGTTSYGTGTTEIGRAAALREGRVLKDTRPKDIKNPKGFFFYDERISDVEGRGVSWNWTKQPNAAELLHFFKILAICHTVVIEEEKDKATDTVVGKRYTAASPDEQCLVSGAKYLGVEFVDRDTSDITIHCHDQGTGRPRVERWKLHEILEFNSDRKRMSIIVKDPQGKLLLFCKGADTVIYERLQQFAQGDRRAAVVSTSKQFLREFAADGLRTLCIAETELDPHFYGDGVQNNTSWQFRYKQAKEAIGGRDEKVAACAEEIEKNLILVGTTAIEDKLQGGVPQTIELLRCAGVNVWILTGDKLETAINIGFACALLHTSMGVFMFEEDVPFDKLSRTILEYAKDAEETRGRVPDQDLGVVVQGSTLTMITAEGDELAENRRNFLRLTEHCRAVVCCRVTPGQKAEVVKLVKEGLGSVTLSIGDGANDVAMITEAHVGIGISGLEGLQAARAADYAIGQFRFLGPLLLVHGRWDYRRVAKVILYSFYKNILLYLTQCWFCFFNAFTGQSLYDRWAIAAYNVGFTAFPIMAIGAFDRDIEKKRIMSLEQFPELYDAGRLGQFFGTRTFWAFVGTAVVQSMLCFFIPMLCLSEPESSDGSTGRPVEMHWAGITVYTCVIWVVTLKAALETISWTWINHLATWGSALTWYIFLVIYGELWSFAAEMGEDWHLMYRVVLSDVRHWFVLIVTVFLALYRDLCWKFVRRTFHTSLLHKVQLWESYARDAANTGVDDFNYTMMQVGHSELLPRPRQVQKAAPRAPAADTVAPPGTVPDAARPRAESGAPGGPPAQQAARAQAAPPRAGVAHFPAPHPADRWQPDNNVPPPPLYSSMSLQRAPPGHMPGTHAVSRMSGALSANHTGYAFSYAEPSASLSQVEALAARAGAGNAGWAQGFSYPRRLSRAAHHPAHGQPYELAPQQQHVREPPPRHLGDSSMGAAPGMMSVHSPVSPASYAMEQSSSAPYNRVSEYGAW
eukprot:TRINITY_DN5006_c0_g2_i1.p1 TRINITY_DN5006_c0_g2~~TRINITY_DN5006_c0_g2_i1.p1  ORF type:complete len:1424 (+),score=501.25 TRINITY_DN5006_c0_g2_i1:74-4273(+)